MAFVSPSRVLETASGSGTGNLTLLGASGSGEYDAFNERLSVGDVTFYVIVDGNQFEIGYGTYSSATPSNGTLTRDTVIRSSSGTSKISLSGSTVNVFSDMPPEKVLVEDHNGVVAQVSAILSTVTVADFATLQAFAIPSDGDAIYVRYGVTVGDGKGGKFYWSAGSSATPDTPASDLTVNTIQSSVTGTGRWLRERDFLHPAEIASSASIPVGDVGRISSSKDLVSNNSVRGLMTVPQVANVAAQASYATFAAFKAAASSQWVQNDLIEVRGITAEGDIDAPLVGVWEASSTNTTNLDSQYLRPDDISGSNPGRLSFPVPVRAVKFTNSDATPSVNATSVFTCADTAPSAYTTFDDMKDGQRIIVQPGAQDAIFQHSSTFKMPRGADFVLKPSDAPVEFYKENGVIYLLGGSGGGVVNAQSYGFLPSASAAANATALQAAIDAAAVYAGYQLVGSANRAELVTGSVYIPSGTYAVSTNAVTVGMGVKLYGESSASTILDFSASAGGTALKLGVEGSGTEYFFSTIEDLAVIGDATLGALSLDGASSSIGVLIGDAYRQSGIKNCIVWGFDVGVSVEAFGWFIENCWIVNHRTYCIDAQNGTASRIDNSRIEYAGEACFRIRHSQDPVGVTLNKCVLQGSTKYALDIYDVETMAVRDCFLENNNNDASNDWPAVRIYGSTNMPRVSFSNTMFNATGAVSVSGGANDGAVTSATTTFTSASASFSTAVHKGQIIAINGAGVSGATLTTRIASVTNTTTVELEDAASTTVSGATYTLTRWGDAIQVEGTCGTISFDACLIRDSGSDEFRHGVNLVGTLNHLQYLGGDILISGTNDFENVTNAARRMLSYSGLTNPDFILGGRPQFEDAGGAMLFRIRALDAGDNATLSLLAGDGTGESILGFGDDADEDIGRLRYLHSTNEMQVYTSNNPRLKLSGNTSDSTIDVNAPADTGNSTIIFTDTTGTAASIDFDHNTGRLTINVNGNIQIRLDDGAVIMPNLKSGTTAGGAGAGTNELWVDTSAGNVIKRA